MKRILALVLSICLLAGFLIFPASAETETSGKCGDNLTWTFSDSILTISGTGAMYDYSEENPAPWKDLHIHKCIIENGATRIGTYTFLSKKSLTTVYIPSTVTEIGEQAFCSSNSSYFFFGKAPAIADNAFEGTYGNCYYVFGWEEANRQNYGGTLSWQKLSIHPPAYPKMIYLLNEKITVDDFKFYLMVSGTYPYTPQTFQTEPYDNSTCGEKSVKIIADDLEFTHTYFVSDGQSHLALVNVDTPSIQYYTGNPINVEPVVTVGSLTLTKDVHYTLSYQNNTDAGSDATVTVTGIGEWEGLEKTLTFRILKQDISNASTYVHGVGIYWDKFTGEPLFPSGSVSLDGSYLTESKDFVTVFENNVNIGTAFYRIIGIGNYYGSQNGEFEINNENESQYWLKGEHNGNAATDSELNDAIYYSEKVLSPGVYKGWPESKKNNYYTKHYAYYELYQLIDGEPVLVTTQETDYGYYSRTEFSYDFSSVYEDAAEEGGAIYMLAYSWIDSDADVYSGVCVLYIPAKVPDATAMEVAYLADDGDYSKEYFTVFGVDGNVGDVTWTSSDPSVATVDDGVVTLIKPGTLTITAQYGDLIVEVPCEVAGRSLTECDFFHFDTQTETAYVSCEHILMRDGTDYTCTVSSDGKVTEVTLTGTGLFSGQLVLQLDAETGEPLSHAHSFDSLCDGTCNQCDYTRQAAEHTPAESWTKNQTHHWHACTACGAKTDEAEHVLSPEDSEVCTVCGTLYIPGDIDCNMLVNRDDVVQLLLHVSMPDAFPIEVDADFTGDGTVNRDDVVQLLLHVSMPDAFPLPA